MNYTNLADKEAIDATIKALAINNIEGQLIDSGVAALDQIKKFIPQGASVMNGSSTTLEQIGFVEYLKSGAHKWNNLHSAVLAEQDPEKQKLLRRQAVISDYYVGSVHALSQTGEFIIASNTGSQLPHIVYTSTNLLFVVSTKKIVPTLDEAMKRLTEHVVPLEDKRMKTAYGVGTRLSKVLMFKYEHPMGGRKVRVLLVNEDLGF